MTNQGDDAAAMATETPTPDQGPRPSIEDLLNMDVNDMTTDQRARFEIKREHEFYSYYEPIRALATTEMDWTDLNSDEAVAKHRPTASPDKALTAFCQLAAIRLKMRRAMIFFFDTTHAYILAEATRTLSLHDDAVFDDEEDGLWLGTTKIPRGFSVCEHTVNLPSNGGTNAEGHDSHIIHIINNLTEDTRFCNRPYVTGGPRARFYAGVPITTPKGLKIGAFCVLDDKVHEGLGDKDVGFMQEMGAAVMSHLDMIKAKVEQRRGTDMVAALGAFTASESSSRRDMKTDDARPQLEHDLEATSSLLTIGNLDSPHPKRPAMRRQSSSSKLRHPSNEHDQITNIRERSPRRQRPSWFTKNRARSDMSVYTESAILPESTPVETASDNPKAHPAEQSPSEIMQSASTLIRKAVDADGVLFLDAAITGFGNLINSSFLENTPDDDAETTTSGTDGHQTSEGEDTKSQGPNADDQPCPVLGASYAPRSGAVPDPEGRREIYSQLTPKFLRFVLRRFKGAKVWNFNENGDDYLDEQASESHSASDGGLERSSSKASDASWRRRNRKRSLKHAPGKQLAAAFPGVRSLMVLGLWDPQRNQWRAGCVIWSCTPMRMFSNEGEMHYLTAFCDVIMAKLARLDVDVSNNIKSDFISSISHELRSPLHGILGTVEILQDQNVDNATAEMISQIDTCGRTLLDIVDHLLEFSRINVLTRHTGSKMRPVSRHAPALSSNNGVSDTEASSLDVDVSLDAITEEVVESAVYSFCCSKDQRTLSERNVTVSIDIEKHPHVPWDCKLTVGAWKRVCVNLVNNALKYTSEGSINVSLKILPPTKKLGRPIAQLSVIDTGRGMSKDFLRTKLFRAFSQEDDMAEGTGLGMSMVARIVKGWKGKVDVRSSKGQGSIVSVTMPMHVTRRPRSADLDGASLDPMINGLAGLAVHVMGSPDAFEQGPIATGRYQQLVTFTKMCSGMGLNTSGPAWQSAGDKDFAVVAEYDLPRLMDTLPSPRIKQSTGEKTSITSLRTKPIVVLCRDYISARNLKGCQLEQLVRGRVEYIAQPCGPNRLATVINRVLEHSGNGEQWTSRPHSPPTPNTPYESVTPRFDTWRESHTWSGASSPNETETTRRLTLRSRRTSSETHTPSVSLVTPKGKSQAEQKDNDPHGLGVETAQSKIPDVADGALTAPALASVEPSSLERNQSVVSLPPDSEAARPCLLLVDDNPINLQLLVTYAKKNNHPMLKATDGSLAVSTYKSAHSPDSSSPPPEVILMDISMPIMDGFEASRQIRAFEREKKLKPVVIIALTGLGSSEAQHEAFVSGINLFLTKPVRLKELTRLLGTIKDTFG
ncbi:hypothetical protein D6D19_02512 [Aureobasidium pullulans]|uniref:histidine kinase n=1 Tax=Aureobasidium pullulans TaxID=5580 RepID=A0A4S9ACS9_AURPU|nr:hypothetical protein D6D19_02512 [Aureobasidium pullulans]